MNAIPESTMTAEEFFEWCNREEHRDRFFELERGRVVEYPLNGERHGLVCANLHYRLGAYLRDRKRGLACANNTGVIWERNPDTVRGPDAILYEKGKRYDQLSVTYTEDVPQLIAEVLSPDDRFPKVLRRVTEFLRKGVGVGWIIDPETRTVTVVRLNEFPQVLEENDELTGAPPFPDLRCRVADLFYVPGK